MESMMTEPILQYTQPNGTSENVLIMMFASVALEEIVNPDEKNVYELVTRHFLACCSKVWL